MVTSHHFSLHQGQQEKGFPHRRIVGENEANEGQRHEAEAAPAKGEPGGIAGLRCGNAHFGEIVSGSGAALATAAFLIALRAGMKVRHDSSTTLPKINSQASP